MTQPRIVSLLASSTEVICRLGFEDYLVGCSHECDYPETVTKLPQVSRPKFKSSGDSKEIDEEVKKVVQEGLGVYHVDAEKLEELQPTHIVTQDHCHVCAVSFDELEDAVCQIVTSHPKIINLNYGSLSEVFDGFKKVASGLDQPEKGEELVAELEERMEQVASKTKKRNDKPRVAHIEWLDPLMSGGNWMPDLIEKAGGINLFGESGGKSPKFTWDEFCEIDPEMILISPCGFTIDRTIDEIFTLTEKPGWADISAVKNKRVAIADGHQYFNRAGPRLADSVEILAELFFPNDFSYGYRESRAYVMWEA